MSGWWSIVILLSANLMIEVHLHKECRSYPKCICERVTTNDSASHLIRQFCQEPKYAVPSELPRFSAEPQSGAHSKGSRVVLYCNISANNEPGFSEPTFFTWRHNGEVVAKSSAYSLSSKPGYSSLTISSFSAASQGEYYCRVENGNYSLVSRIADLQLQPEEDTWIDEAYPPQPTNSEIQLRVQNGHSIILECHLNTNSVYEIHWTLNKKSLEFTPDVKNHYILQNSSLLVRDITGEDRDYMCIISLPGVEKSRSFHLSVEKAVAGEQLKFSVTPKNKTIVQGSNVSLYCVAEASTPPTITWFKNGTPITAKNSSVLNATVVGGGEVLLLTAVTMESGGNYTCVATSGEQLVSTTAYVTAPPTSATIGDHYSSHSDVFIPMNRNSINLTLACSRYPQSASRAFDEYSWAFRGEPIDDSVATLFHRKGNTLMLIATDVDPWSAIGSYQCFISNPAGRVQTSIRVLPQGKLNPPSRLDVVRDPLYFQYDLTIHPSSQVGDTSVNGYTTEILIVKAEADIQKCVCNSAHEDGNIVRFFASNYTQSVLYFRTAATNDAGITSDFASYPDRIYVSVGAPPSPTGLRADPQPAADGCSWLVTLSWRLADECTYPIDLYSQCIQVDCDTTSYHDERQVTGRECYSNLSLPCNTTCTWTITVAYNGCGEEKLSNYTNSTFTTPFLPPTEPPVLLSVDRALSDGRSINFTFTLPPNDISCHPSSIIIRYSNATYSKTVTAALSSDTATTRSITALLTEAECWREYNISIASSNSAGNSAYSHPKALRGPMQDDVRGYTNISIQNVSSTAITVDWQLEKGMECLLSTGFISGELCCIKKEEKTCGSSGNRQCHPAVTSSGSFKFSNLTPHQEYCFTAAIKLPNENGSVINSVSKTALTGESAPDCPPANLSVLLSASTPTEMWLEWDPPPQECKNGVLKHYNVTITTTDDRIKPETQLLDQTKYTIREYSSSLDYGVYVSACTSVGCGPTATQTILRTSDPTTATEQATPSTSTSHDSNTASDSTPSTSHDSNTVIIAATTAGGVFSLTLLAIVLVIVVVKKCSCGPCRKNREEDAEPFPRGYRDEPLSDDLPVSVTPQPAPSVSERTVYSIKRYLDDPYDLGLPDGSVDNNTFEEESDSHKGLLDSSSVRDGIGEWNCPERHERQAEGLELESLPPDMDEGTEEDTCPLISSEQRPTARPTTNRGSGKQRGKSKKATEELVAISSSQTSATDAETIQRAAPLISSLPKQLGRPAVLNSGYVTDAAASAVPNAAPVLTSTISREPPSPQIFDFTVYNHHSKPAMSNSQRNPIRSTLPTTYLSSLPESPREIPFSCDPDLTSFPLLTRQSPVGRKLCQQDSGYVQESTGNSSSGNHITDCTSPPPTRQEYPPGSPSTFPRVVSTYQSSSHHQSSTRTVVTNRRRHKEATTKNVNRQDSGYVQESAATLGDFSRQLPSEDAIGLVFAEEYDDSCDGFNSTVNPEVSSVATQQQVGLLMSNSQAVSRQQYCSSHIELSTSTVVPLDSQSSSTSKRSLAGKALCHQNSGYVQGNMEESSHGLHSVNPFDFVVEEFDDAASDDSSHSSVFNEPQAREGFEGHTTAFHPGASVPSNQRTRLLTSGVYSQSSEGPEPVPDRPSDAHVTSYITDTAIGTTDIDAALVSERRNSEGYFSQPPTPFSKKPMDFTLPQTSQAREQGSGTADTASAQVVPATNTAQSRPFVKFAGGYYRESPEKSSSGHSTPASSTIGTPKTAVSTSPLSRQPPAPKISTQVSPMKKSLHHTPSMVTCLYDRSTSMPHSEGAAQPVGQAKLQASTTAGNVATLSTAPHRDALPSGSYVQAATPFTDSHNSRQESQNSFRDNHHLYTSSKTETPLSKDTHTFPLHLRNTISAPLDSTSSFESPISRPKALNSPSAITLPLQKAGNTGYYTAQAPPTPSQSNSTGEPVLGAGNPGSSTAMSHRNGSQRTVENTLPKSEPMLPRYTLPSLLRTVSTTSESTPALEAKSATFTENERSRTPLQVSKSATTETVPPRNQLDLLTGFPSSSASQESLASSDDFPLLAMSEERQEVFECHAASGYV